MLKKCDCENCRRCKLRNYQRRYRSLKKKLNMKKESRDSHYRDWEFVYLTEIIDVSKFMIRPDVKRHWPLPQQC